MAVLAADSNNTTTTPPSSHPGGSLAWVAAPILLLVVVGVALLCGLWFRWLYMAGERRYWGRVHNEHLRAAGSGGGSGSTARQERASGSTQHQGRDSSEETDESMDNDRRGLFTWNV